MYIFILYNTYLCGDRFVNGDILRRLRNNNYNRNFRRTHIVVSFSDGIRKQIHASSSLCRRANRKVFTGSFRKRKGLEKISRETGPQDMTSPISLDPFARHSARARNSGENVFFVFSSSAPPTSPRGPINKKNITFPPVIRLDTPRNEQRF